MQSCIKFYAGGTGRDVIHADSPEKSKDSKEIDDRIDQVFVYVIAGSNGFERVAVFPCSRWGRSEKRSSMIGECAFLGYFFSNF